MSHTENNLILPPTNTGWEVPWPTAICRTDYPAGAVLPYSVNKVRVIDGGLLPRTLWISTVRYDLNGIHEDCAPQVMNFLAGPEDKVFSVNLTTVNSPGERWLRIHRDSGLMSGNLIALGFYNEIGGQNPYEYTSWINLSSGRPFDSSNDTGFPPLT